MLVETLGDQGEKADFKTEQFSAPQVTWTAGLVPRKIEIFSSSSLCTRYYSGQRRGYLNRQIH